MIAKYAGALLITNSNTVLLQRRDSKPGIMNPGLITTFGGAVESGETPDQAIHRELKEELGLKHVNPEFYRIFNKTLVVHGEDREMHIYLVRGINPQNIHVYEGKGYVEIGPDADLGSSPLTKMAKEIVADYFAQF